MIEGRVKSSCRVDLGGMKGGGSVVPSDRSFPCGGMRGCEKGASQSREKNFFEPNGVSDTEKMSNQVDAME